MNAESIFNYKLNLYFALSKNQQKKINSLVYSYRDIELIDMKDFLKITKKKHHIETLIRIKRASMRLCA